MYRLRCDFCSKDIVTKTLYKMQFEKLENKDYFQNRAEIIGKDVYDCCIECKERIIRELKSHRKKGK